MSAMVSDMEHIIEQLDNIFETVNIVQSIIIVRDDISDELYDALVERDYPVAAYFCDDEVRNFIAGRSRMLMVTESEVSEFKHYEELLTKWTNILINTTDLDVNYLNLPNKVAIIHIPCPTQITTDQPIMP